MEQREQEVFVFWSAIPISSEGGDDSFQNNVPDPATFGSKLPTFKFELEKSEGRVMGGSYGKEATVVQLPISKALAGVSMRMEPGVMRELHWHATAAEWAFVSGTYHGDRSSGLLRNIMTSRRLVFSAWTRPCHRDFRRQTMPLHPRL